jgi:hypothetical protein
MASESKWRQHARQALQAAVARGQAQGLAGAALEAFARKEGYPFGAREMTPYKLWRDEARRMFGNSWNGRLLAIEDRPVTMFPARVLKLRGDHNSERMLWLGRVTLGDWLLIQYRDGELVAVVAEHEYQLSHGRACFREQIAGPESQACSILEAAAILEAAGLFDFSAIDLSELKDCPK